MNGITIPSIGLAYSAAIPSLLSSHSAVVDHVEIPFELLCHDPSVVAVDTEKAVIVHCASLSLADPSPPSDEILERVGFWAERTKTPWIGEHLSFITADPKVAGISDAYAPGEPYNIGYTVSPVMNMESAAAVSRKLRHCAQRLGCPILVENPPIYFPMPGSTLSQSEFISQVCERTEVGLLLDLAHFCISSRNMGYDPRAELHRLPLERVVEIHISGVEEIEGECWDDHASSAPEIEIELLRTVLQHVQPRAVTLEYNWNPHLPSDMMRSELDRIRTVVTETLV